MTGKRQRKRKQRRTQRMNDETGLAAWNEWVENQYNPGYYVGGRLSPWLRGKRPNRFGYTLITTGVIVLVVGGTGWLTDIQSHSEITGEVILRTIGAVLATTLFGIVPLLAGIKLLRRP